MNSADKEALIQSIDDLSKRIRELALRHPESKAKAKAERKDALTAIDVLLQFVRIYVDKDFDNLMSPLVAKDFVRWIIRDLKLDKKKR